MDFVNFLLSLTASLGYFGIFILMVVESSFIPFPSEIVIPPAAYLASQGEMNVFGVVLVGILGSLVGALINYILALTLGRGLVYRIIRKPFFRFLLLNDEKLKRAEAYFKRHGAMSTFLGRLLPGIRQLISIPAGFARMNLLEFCAFTVLGAGFWVILLALLGYYFGESKDLLQKYYSELSVGLFILVLLVVLLRFSVKRRRAAERD